MTAELKPCPFCGGEAHIDGTSWTMRNGKERSWVTCRKCGTYGPSSEDAFGAWNTRADLPRPEDAQRIAELEAEIAQLREPLASQAAVDVLAERRRQQAGEGWTHERDDTYTDGELARAASAYAAASTYYHADPYAAVLSIWPWSRGWLKPTTPRRDLVKAGALILAEIERLDRAALSGPAPGEGE